MINLIEDPIDLRPALQQYLHHAFKIFPVHGVLFDQQCGCRKPKCRNIGKHPDMYRGLLDASNETSLVTRWLDAGYWEGRNIGLVTGISTGGPTVLDIDVKSGGIESLAHLEAQHGPLPRTPTAATGGGGRHHYFRTNNNVPNSAGRVATGIDVRGDGGYVVAPPSIHRSGVRYSWLPGLALGEVELAEIPTWLHALMIKEAGSAKTGKLPTRRGPGRSTLRELATGGVSEGGRNVSVAKLAGHLLSKGIDPYVTVELLMAWNRTKSMPPLEDDEVLSTVNSIAKSEARRRAGGAR